MNKMAIFRKIAALVICILAVETTAFANNAIVSKSKASSNSIRHSKALASSYNLGAKYAVRQDQNQNRSVKSSRSLLELTTGYSLNESFAAGMSSTVIWWAEGKNIKKQEDNPSWEDLELQLSYQKKLENDLAFNIAIVDALPTGNESRTEGIRNTLGPAIGLSKSLLGHSLKLNAQASASYIWQTYDYSITSGESNPDSFYTGTLSASYKLIDSLSLGLNYTLWSFHLINGENNLARNQAATVLTYRFSNFSIFASYALGNYDKNDGFKVLYVDDSRQMITLGASFEI